MKDHTTTTTMEPPVQDQQDQPIANQRVVSRREFLKTSAGAAVGAASGGTAGYIREKQGNKQ